MIPRSKTSDTLVHLFFLVCIAVLVGGFLFLLKEVKRVGEQKPQSIGETIIKEIFPAASATPKTVVKEKVVEVSVTLKPEKKITYLNLNGAFTTTSTDWTDIKATDAWINAEAEYGRDVYIDWEAAIKTSSSGSKVFVRLYDATHNIAVNGSELESSSTTSARVSSGRLYLWRGQNIYRVQIKSLNGLDATFDGGRIKIVY